MLMDIVLSRESHIQYPGRQKSRRHALAKRGTGASKLCYLCRPAQIWTVGHRFVTVRMTILMMLSMIASTLRICCFVSHNSTLCWRSQNEKEVQENIQSINQTDRYQWRWQDVFRRGENISISRPSCHSWPFFCVVVHAFRWRPTMMITKQRKRELWMIWLKWW